MSKLESMQEIANMGTLKHMNVIVTGATSGIGEAIARKFASEGMHVALLGRRREKGQYIVDEINKGGGEAFFIETDVTSADSISAMYKVCLETFNGPVAILINNAGITTGNAPIEYLSEANWDVVINTNLKGTFLCSKAVIPDMIKNGGGSIINISSGGAYRAYIGGSAYSASKSAVIMLTKTIALEHGKDKIRCNCISPGSIHSEMFDGGIKFYADKLKSQNSSAPTVEQMFANIAKGIPLGRIGEPGDVSELAYFLSSDKASFINGAVITIDGGQTL